MSTETIEFSIPLDEDGFVELQCPFCKEVFRLNAEDVESDDVIGIFCPSCGLTGEINNFLTDDVLESAQIAAMNMARAYLNDSLKKLERESKGLLKVTEKLKPEPNNLLTIKKVDVDLMMFDCCGRSAKISPLANQCKAYCPYCGVK